MNGMLNTQMTALQTGLHTRRPGKSRPGSPKGPSPTATVFSEISGSVANLRRPVPSVAAAVAVAAMQANGRRATEDRTPTHTPPDSGSLQSSVHNNKSPFAGSTNAGSSAEHESYKKSVTRKKSGANDALPRKETFSALPEIAETPNESPVSSPGSDAKKMKDELGGVVDSNENVTKPWLKQASDNPFAKGVTPADQGAWERSGEEAERRPRPASSKKPPAADSLAGKQAKKQSVVANWIMAALNGRQSTGTGAQATHRSNNCELLDKICRAVHPKLDHACAPFPVHNDTLLALNFGMRLAVPTDEKSTYSSGTEIQCLSASMVEQF